MDDEILRKQMKSFPLEKLKDFLGRDLVDSLLEWDAGNGPAMTKARLVDMILNIYGLSVLKNKDFRKELLKSFNKDQVMDFRVDLSSKYVSCDDPQTIINAVAGSQWRKGNKLTERLLRLLHYSVLTAFPDNRKDITPINTLASYDKFYELLDYQYVIRQKAINILTSDLKLKRFLIHMPTGTGKTKTATHIISHYFNYCLHKRGLVVWVAHTSELLEQAYSTFINVWRHIGNGEITTYKLWGDYSFEIPKHFDGFLICGIQKLQALSVSDPEAFNNIVNNARLVVYDEAHKAAASETRETIERFMCRTPEMGDCSLMGLTATPGRSTEDSFDNNLLASMFGNKIIGIDTKLMNEITMSPQEAANATAEQDIIKYFQNRGVLSKVKKEQLTYPEQLSDSEIRDIKVIATNNGYDDFSKKALETIGRNKSRNRMILGKLKELNAKKIPTIVFACSVQHGQLLSSMLSLDNVPNVLIIGNMSTYDREKAIRKFKDENDDTNIIINYEVLTTGFDATNIGCVFITRPTQSVVLYSQMLGRGLRGPQMGGNAECLLIDIKDNLRQYNENMAFSHFDNYWSE